MRKQEGGNDLQLSVADSREIFATWRIAVTAVSSSEVEQSSLWILLRSTASIALRQREDYKNV